MIGQAGDKVVKMTEWQGAKAAHPALAQLRAYWEALRAEAGDLPTRAMVDPRGIERALEFAFVAERVAPGVARLRLAGMHLNDLMGMEVRGLPLTALFEPMARDEVQRQVERAFAGPAAVELRLEATRGLGRPALSAQLLMLPLRTDTGEVARVLGALVAEGDIGRAPRRFCLSSARDEVVPAAAPRRRAEPPPLPVPAPGPFGPAGRGVPARAAGGFRDPAAPFGPVPGADETGAGTPADAPAKTRAGHLRLVHSAD